MKISSIFKAAACRKSSRFVHRTMRPDNVLHPPPDLIRLAQPLLATRFRCK